jgi:hypothetical protein
VLERKMPRKIFRPKTDEITKDWRKLHNKELHILQILLLKGLNYYFELQINHALNYPITK